MAGQGKRITAYISTGALLGAIVLAAEPTWAFLHKIVEISDQSAKQQSFHDETIQQLNDLRTDMQSGFDRLDRRLDAMEVRPLRTPRQQNSLDINDLKTLDTNTYAVKAP